MRQDSSPWVGSGQVPQFHRNWAQDNDVAKLVKKQFHLHVRGGFLIQGGSRPHSPIDLSWQSTSIAILHRTYPIPVTLVPDGESQIGCILVEPVDLCPQQRIADSKWKGRPTRPRTMTWTITADNHSIGVPALCSLFKTRGEFGASSRVKTKVAMSHCPRMRGISLDPKGTSRTMRFCNRPTSRVRSPSRFQRVHPQRR